MQDVRLTKVNGREIPVLISDEKEALLAAKAAGGAIIGLWRPGQEMDAISAAKYVTESLEDVTDEYLERVARRHLGLPWKICETERLEIRELFASDFDEVRSSRVGMGFDSVEELEAYTLHQYEFYEFGIWALIHKESRELAGVAGLKVPDGQEGTDRNAAGERYGFLSLECGAAEAVTGPESGPEFGEEDEILELGYHIFPPYRRCGLAEEACRAILQYGKEELGVTRFMVRIAGENEKSIGLARKLGFII